MSQAAQPPSASAARVAGTGAVAWGAAAGFCAGCKPSSYSAQLELKIAVGQMCRELNST